NGQCRAASSDQRKRGTELNQRYAPQVIASDPRREQIVFRQMAVDARCAIPAGGLASGVLCVPKRSPPGAERCGHCARGKRTRKILRPTGPARHPVAASKHRARSELRSRRKLLPNLREFHSMHNPDQHCALRVDTCFKGPLYYGMRFAAALLILTLLAVSAPGKAGREEPKVVEKVTPLPVVLDPKFEFRKTKLFFMSE